jgi:hypothetical protein
MNLLCRLFGHRAEYSVTKPSGEYREWCSRCLGELTVDPDQQGT